MRPFLIRLTLFLAIQGIGVAILLSGYQPNPADYYAALPRKHAAAEAQSSPRILIVGGSNGVFSFDSAMIEAAFGRPTINLSMHAALGYRISINEARQLARPGDIVIFSIAYGTEPTVTPASGWQAITQYPAIASYMSPQDIPLLLDTMPAHLGRLLSRRVKHIRSGRLLPADPLYSAYFINERGDMEIPASSPPRFPLIGRVDIDPDTTIPTLTAEVGALARDLQARGVTFVYVPTPLAASVYSDEEADIREIHAALATVGIVCQPPAGEVVYPDTDFHDSIYHLKRENRARYTQTVITALAASLPTAPAPPNPDPGQP